MYDNSLAEKIVQSNIRIIWASVLLKEKPDQQRCLIKWKR